MAFTFAARPDRFTVQKSLTKISLMSASNPVAYSPSKSYIKKVISQCRHGVGDVVDYRDKLCLGYGDYGLVEKK